jgi:hypothetical protein
LFFPANLLLLQAKRWAVALESAPGRGGALGGIATVTEEDLLIKGLRCGAGLGYKFRRRAIPRLGAQTREGVDGRQLGAMRRASRRKERAREARLFRAAIAAGGVTM